MRVFGSNINYFSSEWKLIWLVPSHRTGHKILSHGGHLSSASNTTFKIMSWPKSKSISSVVSSLPLWELSLHTNQSDFPPLSGSISFHNKNQFSVTLSSPVKVNSPHADIHIQMSPPVTTPQQQQQSNPRASLYELIWFTHRQTKLIPTHTCRINFLLPA